MATGALDANGIWQYGEDDSEPTFSGMLNKLASSTSTTVTRLEEMSGLTPAQLTTHRDNIGVGLVNVAPASVAQSGGSASATDLGVVTFTGVTSVSLNNVFSAEYKNYRIIIDLSASTASGYLLYRARRTGTDLSGATSYIWGYSYVNISTNSAGVASGNGASSIRLIDVTSGQGGVVKVVGDLVNGYSTGVNSFHYQTQSVSATPSNIGAVSGSGRFTPTSEHDGFTLYASAAGNITGTVQVFGYNS